MIKDNDGIVGQTGCRSEKKKKKKSWIQYLYLKNIMLPHSVLLPINFGFLVYFLWIILIILHH
jgi:nitrate reductase NapE component